MAGTCLKAEAQLANALQPMQYLEAQIRQLSAKHFGHSSQKPTRISLVYSMTFSTRLKQKPNLLSKSLSYYCSST